MRRQSSAIILASAVLGVAAALAAPAHAEVYLSLGAGTATTVDGRLDMQHEATGVGRIGLGQRVSFLALESTVRGGAAEGVDRDMLTLAIGLKPHLRLVGPLELYGHVGLGRTGLALGDEDRVWGWSSFVGGGAQLRLAVDYVASAAVYVDYEQQRLGFADDIMDGRVDTVTAGLSLGLF
jgi:hypothetical protein